MNPKNPEEKHIVCFMSRLLTEVERRYSQCEKEALAVVWACERAHIYLIGHKFLIAVDNRAMQLIYGNAKSKPPARIERWALRLTQFDFTIAHRPGKSNIADYYSRSPGGIGISAYIEEIRSEQYISIVVQSAIPPAMTLREISEATNNDKELCELRKCLKSEKGATKELRQFENVWNELSVTREGVILRCHRIVIPVKLQERVIELAHGGHQGIVKTKSLLRSRVWFRKMDEMVEKFVKMCCECQANTDRQTYEPLKPSKMPDRPWQRVSGDFFGPMEDGWYWFVNICEHSNWASVERIRATSEEFVEPILDHLFATFGSPEVYKSDNGSPFQSHAFAIFAKKWGFQHRRVTPEWPRANGKAESFMKKLGKVLKTCKVSGQDKQTALIEFLRRYRETPHSTTGIAPNHLMFGFSRSSGIPSFVPETAEQREIWRKTALDNDARAKSRMEAEYNQRMRARETNIRVGSKVLIKLKKHRKDTPVWDILPYTVIEINGSMITASRHDHVTTRNSSFFKLYRHIEFELNEPEEKGERESLSSKRREEAEPENVKHFEQTEVQVNTSETNAESKRKRGRPQNKNPRSSNENAKLLRP